MMKAEYIPHEIGDLAVVNNAKVSFGTDEKSQWVNSGLVSDKVWDGLTSAEKAVTGGVLSDKDKSLINYLANGLPSKEIDKIVSDLAVCNNHEAIRGAITSYKRVATHWAPFAHENLKVKMSAPIPIRTHCFKHKQGLVESECSMRYIDSAPEIFVPEFRQAVSDKKQGSGCVHPDNEEWQTYYKLHTDTMVSLYEAMIKDEICAEQARFVLPQGAIVNWIWTGNLASFARYYNQRTDDHAQKEGADLARQVGDIISELYPVSWAALTGME